MKLKEEFALAYANAPEDFARYVYEALCSPALTSIRGPHIALAIPILEAAIQVAVEAVVTAAVTDHARQALSPSVSSDREKFFASILAEIAAGEALRAELEAVKRHSTGVAGYHLNGDIASWVEVGL